SPFIAWLKDRSAAAIEKVTLFYFFTPGRDLRAIDVLTEMARERGAELVLVAAGKNSPESTTRFTEIVRAAGVHQVEISFCGPKGLLGVIRARMKALGIPKSNLRHEYFEFR